MLFSKRNTAMYHLLEVHVSISLRQLEVSLIELSHISGVAQMESLKRGKMLLKDLCLCSLPRWCTEGTNFSRQNVKQASLLAMGRSRVQGVSLAMTPLLCLAACPQAPRDTLFLVGNQQMAHNLPGEKLAGEAPGGRTGWLEGSGVKKVIGQSDSVKRQSREEMQPLREYLSPSHRIHESRCVSVTKKGHILSQKTDNLAEGKGAALRAFALFSSPYFLDRLDGSVSRRPIKLIAVEFFPANLIVDLLRKP